MKEHSKSARSRRKGKNEQGIRLLAEYLQRHFSDKTEEDYRDAAVKLWKELPRGAKSSHNFGQVQEKGGKFVVNRTHNRRAKDLREKLRCKCDREECICPPGETA